MISHAYVFVWLVVTIQHVCIIWCPYQFHVVHGMISSLFRRSHARPERKKAEAEYGALKRRRREKDKEKCLEKTRRKERTKEKLQHAEWKKEKTDQQQKRETKKKGTVSKLLVKILLSLCQLMFGFVKKEFQLLIMVKALVLMTRAFLEG